MKKILYSIILTLGLLYSFTPFIVKADETPCPSGQYCLLEPLQIGDKVFSEFSADTTIGGYVNIMFKIIIGIVGVLAVVMLVLGGVQYMSTDAISGKESGKETIQHALGGLILALGAFIILNTINPNILSLKIGGDDGIGIVIEVNADEANWSKTETTTDETATSKSFLMSGNFSAPKPSAGVSDFVNYLKTGWKLSDITVDAATKKATFTALKGADSKSVTISINIGYNGFSDPNGSPKPVSGDARTPKGTSYISSDRRFAPDQNHAVLSKDGKYNLGAVFINTGITLDGKDRGIGFHGHKNNTLGSTNGCIRMYNDDLIILGPYMSSGTKVVIK